MEKKKLFCPPEYEIPLQEVETPDGITNLANCFVHVASNNTTYYIDKRHRIAVVWAGPVEEANYDLEKNPRNLRSQFLFTQTVDGGLVQDTLVYFDKQGKSHKI